MYNVNKFKSLLTHYRVDDYCKLNFITNLTFSEFGFSFNSLYLLYVDFCLDLRNEGGVEEGQRSKYRAPWWDRQRRATQFTTAVRGGGGGGIPRVVTRGTTMRQRQTVPHARGKWNRRTKLVSVLAVILTPAADLSVCSGGAWYWYGLLTITPWENATNINLICLFWTYQ